MEISNIVTQDVGVVFKDDKGDYYTLTRDTFEFVKSKLNYIHPMNFIIIHIGHKLTECKYAGYMNKILEYIKNKCVWRKRFNDIVNSEHVITMENVKTVTYGLDDKCKHGVLYAHFHNVELTNSNGETCDFDNTIKNVGIEIHADKTRNNSIIDINFLGCQLFYENKINISFEASNQYAYEYKTLTLLGCKIVSYDNDPVIFSNTCGLLSGYIKSSTFGNMHILANNINISDSSLYYDKPREGIPYKCIFHDSYPDINSNSKFELKMSNSNLILKDDIEFLCNIKLDNVNIDPFSSKDKEVYDEHNIDFFLPTAVDKRYRYKIYESHVGGVTKNSIVGDIFSTYINLYANGYTGIIPHKVTVVIEDLRCNMHNTNKHLFYRAYVSYGTGKSNGIYPLDVLLRDFNKTTQAKFNRRQVKEFYKNIDKIAVLSGINLRLI